MLEKLNPRFKHLLKIPSSASTTKSASGSKKKKKSVAIEDPKEKAAMAAMGVGFREEGRSGSSIRKSALRASLTSRDMQRN